MPGSACATSLRDLVEHLGHALAANLPADLAVDHGVLVQVAAGKRVVAVAVDESRHDAAAREIDARVVRPGQLR